MRGEPILPPDVDSDKMRRRDQIVVDVVDDFIDFNFGIRSADDFFEEQRGRMDELKAQKAKMMDELAGKMEGLKAAASG